MNWTELDTQGKREAVRELASQGLSFGAVARHFGVTPNAVIGVVDRSRVAGDPIVKPPVEKKVSPSRVKADINNRPGDNVVAKHIQKRVKARRKTGFNVLPALIDPAIADTRPPLEGAWAPLPGSSPVALEQVSGCRWPIGDAPPFTFCNDAPAEGSAYCPAHTTMGIRPMSRDERRLAKAPKAVV